MGHSRNFPHHLQNTSILRGIPGRRFSLLIFRQQRLSPGALSYCCRWMRCSFALCPTTHTQERREGVHERIKYTNRAGISYQNILAVQIFQSCHRQTELSLDHQTVVNFKISEIKLNQMKELKSCKHATQSRPRHPECKCKHPRPLLFLWGWRHNEPFDVKAEINISLPVDEKREEILNYWRKHSSNASKHNKS